MTEMDTTGEQVTRKRCVFCGAGPVTLAWRPVPEGAGDLFFTTPLDWGGWWPTSPALDARFSCGKCGNLSYGRLAGGRVGDEGLVDGLFVIMPDGWRPELW